MNNRIYVGVKNKTTKIQKRQGNLKSNKINCKSKEL